MKNLKKGSATVGVFDDPIKASQALSLGRCGIVLVETFGNVSIDCLRPEIASQVGRRFGWEAPGEFCRSSLIAEEPVGGVIEKLQRVFPKMILKDCRQTAPPEEAEETELRDRIDAPPEQPTHTFCAIQKVLADLTHQPKEAITEASLLVDLGVDWNMLSNLITRIEQMFFPVTITYPDEDRWMTVGDVANYIEARQP